MSDLGNESEGGDFEFFEFLLDSCRVKPAGDEDGHGGFLLVHCFEEICNKGCVTEFGFAVEGFEGGEVSPPLILSPSPREGRRVFL